MKLLRTLREISQTRQIPFLLIGGHAVNVHGFSRMTEDVDIAVRRDQSSPWKEALESIGYKAVNDGGAFLQFASGVERGGALDLMLLNAATFEKLATRAKAIQYLGTEISVVAVEHLIALKLHALRQDLAHRRIKDFLDVVELIRANCLDLQSAELREIFTRYGTEDLARRIRIACE
jgi:predicted nucleotidyltransferase